MAKWHAVGMTIVPERLGKYLIKRELGRGAMGVVYEGLDPLIERTVAVKVLHIDGVDEASEPELHMRFRHEAQAAGRLMHPNIVAILEYGEDASLRSGGHSAYLAMEFVNGTDLKTLFASGRRFTLAQTGRIMGQLLSALQHAHEQGVVHRDIKPGNIMLLANGSVKVADFGIARLDSSDLTQAGSVLGTVSHMSPEQLLGLPVDRRSDLFSCGVVLYELLTGDRPFVGSTATVMQKVLHEGPLAPSLIVSTLPKAIDAVVQKALAKNPDHRFPTADAFASALQAALNDTSSADPEATLAWPTSRPGTTPPSATLPIAGPAGHPGRKLGIAGFSAAALLAVGVGGWALWKRGEPVIASPDTRASLPSVATAVAPVLAPASMPSERPATPPPAKPAPTELDPTAAIDASNAKASTVAAARPQEAPAARTLPSTAEIEQQTWDDALKADRAAAYQAYLSGYPNGRYASRARVRLATLAPLAAPARPTAPAVTAAPAAVPTTQATAGASAQAAGAGATDCVAEARRGLARCQVVLANQYRSGKGVPKDLAEAVRWYRKAADQGDAAGQHELGTMLDAGLGIAKDEAQATALFRKAADQGYARSQNRVGLVYERGTGVPVNLPLAVEWFRKAADQGQTNAVANLARLYLRGRGVPKDTAKAIEMLKQAAAKGEPNASYNLGWVYENGEGQPRDLRLAARYYREALAVPGAVLTERNRETAQTFLAANPRL